MRDVREIEAFYEEAGRMLAWPDERLFGHAEGVSGWSAAQHLEHLAKTNGRTFKGLRLLAAGKLPAERGRPNGWGLLVLHLRRFPRGRVQAPGFARPADELSREELERSLARNRDAFAALAPYLSALPRREYALAVDFLTGWRCRFVDMRSDEVAELAVPEVLRFDPYDLRLFQQLFGCRDQRLLGVVDGSSVGKIQRFQNATSFVQSRWIGWQATSQPQPSGRPGPMPSVSSRRRAGRAEAPSGRRTSQTEPGT